LNIIKAAIGMVIDTSKRKIADTLQVKPVMTPYIPMNDTELVENLSLSVGNGIMSRETAIEQNPYVVDPEIEIERTRGEKDETDDLTGKGDNEELKKVPPTK